MTATPKHAPIKSANLSVINHSQWANLVDIPYFFLWPALWINLMVLNYFSLSAQVRAMFKCITNELKTDKKMGFFHTITRKYDWAKKQLNINCYSGIYT